VHDQLVAQDLELKRERNRLLHRQNELAAEFIAIFRHESQEANRSLRLIAGSLSKQTESNVIGGSARRIE
jgi:hypothetical protein